MPTNRIVVWIKPYLNLFAGAIAAWLVAKVNVLGLPALDQANTATWIAGALAWILTQGATQLGDLKWIKGHHIAMAGDAQVQAAALANSAGPVTGHDMPGEDDITDEDEFAAPPPSDPPIQPSQIPPAE